MKYFTITSVFNKINTSKAKLACDQNYGPIRFFLTEDKNPISHSSFIKRTC